jgi:energy-coupling factor transport system substrate-specific component
MRLYLRGRNVRDLTVFAMLGAIMAMSRVATDLLPPNVHVLGLFIAAITLTYRRRALVPLYVFIMLDGVIRGFTVWWIPYLYVWLPLWGAFMIAGKINIPRKAQAPVYMVLCALHGLSFGTLYAPANAFFFRLSFQGMLAWIIAGIPFDIMHAVGNFAAATLILPLTALLRKLDKLHN